MQARLRLRFDEISRSLSHWKKREVIKAMPSFLRITPFSSTPAQLCDSAKRILRSVFPLASSQQLNSLTIYLLGNVVLYGNADDTEAERSNLDRVKTSISEMGEQDMLMLQLLMERKNQLEQCISNVMKAGYEGGQTAIQSLKTS